MRCSLNVFPLYEQSLIYIIFEVLRLVPNDADVLQTKVFLLLQTDQYGSALELLEMSPRGSSSSQQSSSQFERAYVLYRLHREQEAQELVAANMPDPASHRRVQHLDAQLVS